MGKITRTCELDRVDLKELLSSKCKYGPVWQKYFVLPEDKRLAVGTCAYPAGFTLREWPFYHDEMFYVLQGKAKVTTSSISCIEALKQPQKCYPKSPMFTSL